MLGAREFILHRRALTHVVGGQGVPHGLAKPAAEELRWMDRWTWLVLGRLSTVL